MPKLVMLSAPSASGKSTLAKTMMEADGNMIRLNRDSIRGGTILKWTPAREKWIIAAEVAMATAAASLQRNIIVDDTNLLPVDEARWRGVAKDIGYQFELVKLNVSLEECIKRDTGRPASIGRPAIERQFLRAGLIKWPEDKQVVIFDIDGTLADLQHRVPWITIGATCPACDGHPLILDGIKCPHCVDGKIAVRNHDLFYAQVGRDAPISIVVRWAKECKKHFYFLAVSGRAPEKSGTSTIGWLKDHGVEYDHIFMRRSGVHGPDDIEKQLILDQMLASGLKKENIAFVVDDRPSVVDMWRRNGIRVIPVRGRDDDAFYELQTELEQSGAYKSV